MGYLPIINNPVHERDTLWTVIGRCFRFTHKLNAGQSTVFTFDEQLYAKVKELQWENPDTCRSLFVRLGCFHIAKNFIKKHRAALRRFRSTRGMVGKFRLWWEHSPQQHDGKIVQSHHKSTQAYSEGTLAYNMAKSQSVGSRPRNLERTYNDYLKKWKRPWMTREIWSDEVIQLKPRKHLEEQVERRDILHLREEYDKTLSPTCLYWRHYMKMVMILLQFSRAERTGDW